LVKHEPGDRGETTMRAALNGWSFDVFGESGLVGVVLVHDIYGPDAHIRSVGESLGRDGYPTAVVDLFQGHLPKDIPEGMALRQALRDESVLEALETGREVLRRHAGEATKIGTWGFCMGGGYALLGACHRPFDFAIDFYGRIDSVDDVQGLKGPLLLVLAAEDERVTPWALTELLPAAMRAHKRVQLHLYPNVRHAFHRPKGETYNALAALDAERRVRDFLREQRERLPVASGEQG
jgi:carboxymethylenebutenolidase